MMQGFISFFGLIGVAILVYTGDGVFAFPGNSRDATMRAIPEMIDISIPDFVKNDPKYRIDCAPDADQYESFCTLNLQGSRPEINVTEEMCNNRGCQWSASATNNIPSCYIPIEKGGYGLTGNAMPISDAETQYRLTRLSSRTCTRRSLGLKKSADPNSRFSLFNNDINQLNVRVSVSGTDKIRVTIRDANRDRYEVPVPIQWQSSAPTAVPAKIKFQMTKNENGQIGFRVVRTKTGSILFDTSFFANGFIYDDRYLQIITTTPSRNVYGFGENTHHSFQHNLKNSSRYGIFARDQWPTGVNENLYGTHPFYMAIESDGQAFGAFIFNSNAQDYKFDEFDTDKAMLTYRTIGGILDIMFFAGPTPESVVQQYQSVIGHPYMPPYWALGFQLSRYAFNTLDNMRAAMNRTVSNGIPLDVMYGDIDYFRDQLDFTWDPIRFAGMPEFIDSLHQNGMKFITILDPAIDSEAKDYNPYTEGQKRDIWIKWPENQNLQFNETGNRNMLGYVWPLGKTVFPDFFNPRTDDWWIEQILNFHKDVKFDGLWIDMNEPANFDTNQIQPWNWNASFNRNESWNIFCPVISGTLDNPSYKTAICGDFLSDKTLCMIGEQIDARGKIYKQYDVHNLYGWSETVSTLRAARAVENKRSIIISRSTFPTSGSTSGHWLGDNNSLWPYLKFNIIGMLEFNLFGIPYIGADICGFFGDATETMCQRWMQLGAFNPFFRNHNGDKGINQDPAVFSPAATASNRRAVEIRYTLIPFLYTLFHRVHISGGTVVRSMAHVFPNNSDCWALDEQFLWASSLLIAPVIYEHATTKTLYLPDTERWYEYYTGKEQTTLREITVPAPLDFIPLYLRGGSIIPHQQSAMNTVASRKKPLYLIVALDKDQSASGDLFWDDGDSVDTYQRSVYNYFSFNFNNMRLIIEPWTFKYPEMANEIQFNEVQIFGLQTAPNRIVWNGQDLASSKWNFDNNNKVLNMQSLGLNVSKIHKFVFL